MKIMKISVVVKWLLATGVVVISTYCICTRLSDSSTGREQAEQIAEQVAKHGTILEYKAKVRHSSAIKKTTTAKAVVKDVKVPTYIPNPLYTPFTNALAKLTEEYALAAKDGEVVLTNGFVLAMKDGKPFLKFPEAYAKIGIGGRGIGDELKDGDFCVACKKIEGTDREQMDGIALSKYRRLDEPEFYCTDVTYSALPATKQVDAIRMHGNLEIKNTEKAYAMVEEIGQWMKEDYGAVDLDVKTPAGTLALKKFKIGDGMDVEVKVNWKRQRTEENADADIDISFTTGELVEENKCQRQELGKATDAARASTLNETGVNYFTVKPRVDQDAVAKKVVY